MMADMNDVMARLGAELLPRATGGVSAEVQVCEPEGLIGRGCRKNTGSFYRNGEEH